MASKNVVETADDALRGEAGGSLSPEAQSLWDRYNSVYGNVQSMPTKTVRLRSGATMPILDPGLYYRQRALQKVLGGMNQTGLATRNKPQPGALSQLAPFVSALGSDPKFQKWLGQYFGESSQNWDNDMNGYIGSETGLSDMTDMAGDGWVDDFEGLDFG
jgi:hypothetical protein